MGFTPERRAWLVSMTSEEQVAAIEANTEAYGKQLQALGVAYKETSAAGAAGASSSAAVGTDDVALQTVVQQLSDLSGAVKALGDGVVGLKTYVDEKTKGTEEKNEDEFFTKLTKAMRDGGVRPTEGEGTKDAAGAGVPAVEEGDFLTNLITNQMKNTFGAAGFAAEGGVGTPAAAGVQIR